MVNILTDDLPSVTTLQFPFQKEFLQNEVSHLLTVTSIFFFFFTPFGLAVKMLSNSSDYTSGSLTTAVGAQCSSSVRQNPEEPRR